MDKMHLFAMPLEAFQSELSGRSLPVWRAEQVYRWMYDKRVCDWEQMTNLSGMLRQELAESYALYRSELVQMLECADGARKLLLCWGGDNFTETVLMHEEGRNTVCVSTQIGCAVGCSFCASGLGGLQRSLTAGEIVEQVMRAAALLKAEERISHVVLMGMGEPFANYDETVRALQILNAPWGLAIAARHLTVSTVGIPDKIRAFAAEPGQFTLAVSLHAADDALRERLIPWARRWPLAELFAAIDDYFDKTHREVTLEYVLLDGVNTSRSHAIQLANRIGRSRCNVNLINYNATPGSPFQPAPARVVQEFIDTLKNRGVNAHLRKSKGGAIAAACGQLRRTVRDADGGH